MRSTISNTSVPTSLPPMSCSRCLLKESNCSDSERASLKNRSRMKHRTCTFAKGPKGGFCFSGTSGERSSHGSIDVNNEDVVWKRLVVKSSDDGS